MATDLEKLVVQLSADIKSYENALKKAQGLTQRQTRAIEKEWARSNKAVAAQFAALSRGFGAIFAGGAGLRGAQELIDTATRIQNALKVAGLSGTELTAVYDRLFAAAQQNAAPLESLVTLYGRVSLVQKELGVSTEQLLSFTSNVALALRVAGTDAAGASGALLQLSQALGGGVVRAEEFNSVLEGALPIVQAAAAGLEEAGGSVSRLRQLVVDGKVTSEAFFAAFQAGSVILEQKVQGSTLTVAQSFVRLQNSLVDAAGKLDQVLGASSAAGAGLERLAGIVEGLSAIFDAAANGPIGSFISRVNQLNSVLQSVLPGISTLNSINGEQLKDIAGFIGPTGPQLTEQAIKDYAARNGIGPGTAGGKTGRLPQQVKTVSLDDFAPPAPKGSGTGGRRKGAGSASDYARETAQLKERTAALQAETAAQASLNPLVDDYGFSLERARAVQNLLNAAQKDGKIATADLSAATPELRAEIERLAGAYATAGAESERLKAQQDAVADAAEFFGQTAFDAFSSLIPAIETGNEALDRLLNTLIEAVAQAVLLGRGPLGGLLGGGGGGILGSLFGGLLGGFGGLFGGAAAGLAGVSGAVGAGAAAPAAVQAPSIAAPPAGATQVIINAPINAPGADPAQLARVDASVKQLARSVPSIVDSRIKTRQVRGVRA